MKLLSWITLGGLLLVISPAVFASEKPSCNGRQLWEVRTLDALPIAVNTLLGRNRSGLEGIADRGEKFNRTDRVDSRIPMRRFIFAGINASCALVALESGGLGYSVELIAFEYHNAKWQQIQQKNVWQTPQSLQELVAASRAQ
jgi:hypothetical protein